MCVYNILTSHFFWRSFGLSGVAFVGFLANNFRDLGFLVVAFGFLFFLGCEGYSYSGFCYRYSKLVC